MNSTHQDQARAVMDARLSAARDRHLANQVRHARRLARRAEPDRIPGGWFGRRPRHRSAAIDLPPAVTTALPRPRSMTVRTTRLLGWSRPVTNLRTDQ